MREQVTFAVDPNGGAFYVQLTSEAKDFLKLPHLGATIDTRRGGFPRNLKPGFYQGTLSLYGSRETPAVQWDQVQQARLLTRW